MPTPLANPLPESALAFRGYNQTNLGRTPELLAVPAYRACVEKRLSEASVLCEQAVGGRVDLVARVTDRREAGIDAYGEAIALVFAAELAQLDLLAEVHGHDHQQARLAFGYSLGELTAIAASGAYSLSDVMRIPLTLAGDCAEMAHGVTMGVVFSRAAAIDERKLTLLCEELTAEGQGAIGISAILSPNTMLVVGEGEAVSTLAGRLNAIDGQPIHVRENAGAWPPLHTPLVRARHVPDRASLLIREIRKVSDPAMPIWSLVTGRREFEQESGRELLRRWVDHPQRLWNVVEGVLSEDVRCVVHVGPKPNVIPATFRRLADNVTQQTLAWSLTGVGIRTMQLATRTWLARLLPRRGCLLRAPRLKHVVLEDWLLENAPI